MGTIDHPHPNVSASGLYLIEYIGSHIVPNRAGQLVLVYVIYNRSLPLILILNICFQSLY